jgi:CheY-like chemotaxis protein/DNA repair exonuclease SbcCD ATPase subunit
MTHSVLIVDADQGFTDSTTLALEAKGLMVHVRDDAPLDLIKKLRPTVLMLNVELPKGATTGLSICSRIKRDRDLQKTPILLTSTDASIDMLKKHAQSADRADDYARKPMSIEDVLARLDKLILIAPPPAAPKNGAAHEEQEPVSDEFDVEPEPRTEVRAEAKKDRDTLPPGSPPPTLEREKTTAGAPPPLKREVTIAPSATADDIWRSVRLEEALRPSLDVAEPQPPAKATPEERLAYLRLLAKYYEARDKAFRDAWSSVQAQGQDLAKRTISLAIELDRRERRIEEIGGERATVQQRLLSVETEFKAFQEEITRIFRDKDSEEQGTYARLQQFEQDNVRLKKELDTANEQNKDHERRLQIFQDEVEGLQVEKDDAESKVIELTSTLDDAESRAGDFKARLEATESVASERADEIEKLREKLDRFALDVGQDRQKLVREHDETLAAKDSEHKTALETMELDHRAEIASLLKRHEELLETLTGTHEAEIGSLEGERDAAKKRVGELTGDVTELEHKLRDANSAHEAESTQLRADIEDLEHVRDNLAGELDTTSTLYAAVTEERNALEAELERERAELSAAKTGIEERDAAFAELEAAAGAKETELTERVAELEEELDASQTESFERLAELEKLKKAHEKVSAKAANIETSLKISEKALGVSETRMKALESENAVLKARDDELSRQNTEIEAQHQRLENAHKENLGMLERERERYSRAEDLLIKAKDRIGELQTEAQAFQRRVGELEEETSRKEQELAEAYAAVTDAERKLEEFRPNAEANRQKIEDLERDLRALEATEQALLKEVDARDERIVAIEGELATASGRAMAAEQQLDTVRSQARDITKTNTQQSETMRRIVSALGAGIDVLNKARPADELTPPVATAKEPAPILTKEPPTLIALKETVAKEPPPAVVSKEPPITKEIVFAKEPPPLPKDTSKKKAVKHPSSPPKPSSSPKVFAALVSEATAFEESFADEQTTTDGPALKPKAKKAERKELTSPWEMPKPSQTKTQKAYDAEEAELESLASLLSQTGASGDEEEEDRNVTEIVHLDELK